jgi:glycosyltransferase involved in cell wall biosynthesis
MKPKNVVLFIEGADANGGAEKIGFVTAKLLSEAGFRVIVVTSDSEVRFPLPKVDPADIHCLDLSFLWDEFFSLSKAGMAKTYLKNERRAQLVRNALVGIDPAETVVHFHGFHNRFSFSAMEATLAMGFKTLLTAHDYGPQCPNSTYYNYPEGKICDLTPLSRQCFSSRCVSADSNLYKQYRFGQAFGAIRLRKLHKRLHRIFAVSPFEKTALERFWGPMKFLSVLENPISVELEDRLSRDSRNGYVWIGRVTEEKDLLTALLASKETKVPLTVIGSGPFKESLMNQFTHPTYIDWQSEKEVFEHLRRSRGLLLTSKWYETASLIALESLALGTPVAIPNTCAATSWIKPGVSSLTFDAGSPASLAEVILSYENPDAWDGFSRAAYNHYWQSPYTNERYLNALIDHYEDTMENQ